MEATTDLTYGQALQQARALPSHLENGQLAPIYQYFSGQPPQGTVVTVLSSDGCSPLEVFEAHKPRFSGAERIYVLSVPTYRENGYMNRKHLWRKILVFHAKYARHDEPITGVEFDIIGLKRETVGSPAGVLITNIRYIC
jgi:hypothetical protein